MQECIQRALGKAERAVLTDFNQRILHDGVSRCPDVNRRVAHGESHRDAVVGSEGVGDTLSVLGSNVAGYLLVTYGNAIVERCVDVVARA